MQAQATGRSRRILVVMAIIGVLAGMGWLAWMYLPRSPLAQIDTPAPTTEPFQGGWTVQSPATIAFSAPLAVALDQQLFVLGGSADTRPLTEVQLYNQVIRRWLPQPGMPEAVTSAAIAADSTSIWLIGGLLDGVPSRHVWRYDPASQAWSAGPDLPYPLVGASAVAINHQIHVLGGALHASAPYSDTTTHLALTLDNPTLWLPRTPLLEPRVFAGAGVVKGQILLVGGVSSQNSTTVLARLDQYDPQNNTWLRRADMPAPRFRLGSNLATLGEQLIVFGGLDSAEVPASSVYRYDTGSNVWTRLPDLPQAHAGLVGGMLDSTLVVATGAASPAAGSTWSMELRDSWYAGPTAPTAPGILSAGASGPTIYVIGSATTATLAYQTGAGRWSDPAVLPPRPVASSGQTAVLLDDQLYVLGGSAAAGTVAQRFSARTNTWERIASLPEPLSNPSALAFDGGLYLFGGRSTTGPVTQVLHYDPASDAWQALPGMLQAREAAAVGSDGQHIYVFGGSAASGAATRTMQVYDPATQEWTEAASELPEPVSQSGNAWFIENRFYIPSADAQRMLVFDPRSASFLLGQPDPGLTAGGAAVLIAGQIYHINQRGELATYSAGPYAVTEVSQATPTLIAPGPALTPITLPPNPLFVPLLIR